MKYPINTKEGRHERAVATFKLGGAPVANIWEFLKKKGMSDDEILAALDEATNGGISNNFQHR
jgi:hypothetical protein